MGQAAPRMDGRDARQEVEVVVEDERIDRLTCNEDQPCPWEAKKHRHEEHALLIVMYSTNPLEEIRIQRQTWNDYNAALAPRIGEDVAELDLKQFLKRLKLTTLIFRARRESRIWRIL